MAAIIISIKKNLRKSDSKNFVADDTGLRGADLDLDHDGQISASEMKASLKEVDIRADILLQRVSFEVDMAMMVSKLPFFVTCMVCFLLALIEFSPPGSLSKVHTHIADHFQTGRVHSIKSLEAIYDYMEDFEVYNEQLQATSSKFWCESRYFDYSWDNHIMVPVTSCKSPRLHSLGFADSEHRWTAWEASSDSSEGSSSFTKSAHGDHRLLNELPEHSMGDSRGPGATDDKMKRRLGAGIGESSSTGPTQPDPPCADDNTKLQRAEGKAGDENINCSTMKRDVCEKDLGILYCPKTCGYCAPFSYKHTKIFEKSQVTLLPVMVYQTRFAKDECHGFAYDYEHQAYNPVLSLLPALDGQRLGPVLTCISRTKYVDDAYAFSLPCPESTPAAFCKDGKYKHTDKHTFHGDVIYPKMLIEPHRDIVQMRKLNWLDLQTDTVALSTMIYTEGVEIFTSLTVEFSIDEAGNISPNVKSISYRDMIKESKSQFIIQLIVCSSLALISSGLSIYALVQSPKGVDGTMVYELVSRALLLVYPLFLLITWSQQTPMSDEYKQLLQQFLSVNSMEHDDFEEAVQHYFDVKTHIYEETNWLKRQRLYAYIVCYVQFLQLIFYFSNHPKMAVLTSTVSRAMSNIIHFLMLFGILFTMLAFMAHWMLGEHIKDFGTFGDTISAQGRMIFGEFIYANGASDLNGSMMMVYWLYAFTFMIVMFFTLLNFFLAIIVDAFADVKAENDELVVVGGFTSDFLLTPWYMLTYRINKWPPLGDIIAFLDDVIEEDKQQKRSRQSWFEALPSNATKASGSASPSVEEEDLAATFSPMQLLEKFPQFQDAEGVAKFVTHYYRICSLILCRAHKRESVGEKERPATAESDQSETARLADLAEAKNKAFIPPMTPEGSLPNLVVSTGHSSTEAWNVRD